MEENDTINMIEDIVISNIHPLLSDALSVRASKKNEDAHRFIQDVLVDVNTRLWRLEQKLDKEYMKTDDFINFLHKTLIKAALDLRKEKKRMFANIIVNSALIGNYADYLLGVGAVVRIPRFEVKEGTMYYTNEYYVTQYGAEFVEYVRDQETIEFDQAEEC